jgi:hypothetical protein
MERGTAPNLRRQDPFALHLGCCLSRSCRCGRESDIPSLEAYAKQFEESIEKIRLRRQDFWRGK